MAYAASPTRRGSSRESLVEAFRVNASRLLQVSEPLTLYRIVFESISLILHPILGALIPRQLCRSRSLGRKTTGRTSLGFKSRRRQRA